MAADKTDVSQRTMPLSHKDLSVLAALKHLNPVRVILFVFLMLLAFVLTLLHPAGAVVHFGGSSVEFLCRLWIAASLAVTVAVSVSIYAKFIPSIADDAIGVSDPKRLASVQDLQKWCYLLNLLIVVIAVVIGIAVFFWLSPNALRVISLLAGAILVALLMALDILMAAISNHLLCDVELRSSDSAKLPPEEAQKFERLLSERRTRFLANRDIVLKLDLPILIGVCATWGIGFIFLPDILPANQQAFAVGFATGATTLQIIVGNISFEIISACARS